MSFENYKIVITKYLYMYINKMRFVVFVWYNPIVTKIHTYFDNFDKILFLNMSPF